MDAVDLLIDDLEARKASISGDERVQDSTASRTRSTTSSSRRPNEGSRVSRPI